MPTLDELRERSTAIFSSLMEAETAPPAAGGPGAAPTRPFNWFDPNDALAAAELNLQLSARAASQADVSDGLDAAMSDVELRIATADPQLVRQAFAMFVTHDERGRHLLKPRTVSTAPDLFKPSRPPTVDGLSVSIGGPAAALDYWREDPLANEHHEHWHQVYPYSGLPPANFHEWVQSTSIADLAEILDAAQPGPNWEQELTNATTEQIAAFFANMAQQGRFRELPPNLYQRIYRLNDRHGELFFYMHEQMLARYDAELISHGLERVPPFGPDAWENTVAAGHDPTTLPQYGTRQPFERLPPDVASDLQSLADPIATALQDGGLQRSDGTVAPIDTTTWGGAVEAVISQLSPLDPSLYRGLHNAGHGAIASLAAPTLGVMRSTVTAIRDQLFWEWHKYIDDFSATWQDTLEPHTFDDAPPVTIRNGPAPWQSPDIIICQRTAIDHATDPTQEAEELFGGNNWDTDFSAPGTSGITLATTDRLLTNMSTWETGTDSVDFLNHQPFGYVLRIENNTAQDRNITARIFLVPASLARDRRAWIEMDKWTITAPANARRVHYRADVDSSVIKRRAETTPANAQPGGGPEERSYCDCGWPYTLLLPRGTVDGLEFKLAVICTDTTIDQIERPEPCGSMSFCGAVDRYPDSREMGYPFNRPLGTGPDPIADLPATATRTLTITHE